MLFYTGTTLAAAMYIVGAVEIVLVSIVAASSRCRNAHGKLAAVFLKHNIKVRITGFMDFAHHLVFQKLENATFQNLDNYLSLGEERKAPTSY
jgi:hypothetical protein